MKAKRNACRTKKELSVRGRRAFSRRATFEPLEARHMLSGGNLFAEFVGTLTPAAPVERLDVQIAPEALGLLRDKALLGFEVRGRDGQSFDPAAVQIVRPDGSLVKPEFAADNVPGRRDSVVAELAEGDYTLKVGGSLSARSQFFMDVFLVGDANALSSSLKGMTRNVEVSVSMKNGMICRYWAFTTSISRQTNSVGSLIKRMHLRRSKLKRWPYQSPNGDGAAASVDGGLSIWESNFDVRRRTGIVVHRQSL